MQTHCEFFEHAQYRRMRSYIALGGCDAMDFPILVEIINNIVIVCCFIISSFSWKKKTNKSPSHTKPSFIKQILSSHVHTQKCVSNNICVHIVYIFSLHFFLPLTRFSRPLLAYNVHCNFCLSLVTPGCHQFVGINNFSVCVPLITYRRHWTHK